MNDPLFLQFQSNHQIRKKKLSVIVKISTKNVKIAQLLCTFTPNIPNGPIFGDLSPDYPFFCKKIVPDMIDPWFDALAGGPLSCACRPSPGAWHKHFVCGNLMPSGKWCKDKEWSCFLSLKTGSRLYLYMKKLPTLSGRKKCWLAWAWIIFVVCIVFISNIKKPEYKGFSFLLKAYLINLVMDNLLNSRPFHIIFQNEQL